MKNLFLLLSAIILFISGCSSHENRTPHITLNDSTCIKVIADNIVDTLNVQTSFCSFFPFRPCNGKMIEIVKNGTYYLTYRMTKPELVKFKIGKEFQSFLIPGDTMVINVGFEPNSSKESCIYYKTSGNIHDYYQAKKKKFGYYSFTDSYDNPVSKFFNKMEISLKDYNEAISILNMSEEQNNLFLYENRKKLPKWFVDLEKANITYGSANKAMQLYTRLKNEDRKEEPIQKVKFNNPKARLSSLYYYFLMEYFYFKCPLENNKVEDINRAITQFTLQSHLVDSLLNGEIKDYFITCRLADLYFFSSSAEGIELAKTFITNNYPLLTEDKIKFINYEKDQKIKLLGIKSNLPKGDKAPRFYLKDFNGKPYELKNFKGKIIYLHFWATWCDPCIKEIPTINQLYSRLENKKIEIVNICLDDNPDKWKHIIEKENLKGTNLICKGNWEKSLKNLYFITEVPHFTLVDQDGLIINNKCKGPEEIYQVISKLIDKK
jgi:thiol-disulfide isomerase/thioredoxin